MIRLTEEGKRFGESVIFPIYDAEQRAVDNMTSQEQQLCTELLAKYISFLDKEI